MAKPCYDGEHRVARRHGDCGSRNLHAAVEVAAIGHENGHAELAECIEVIAILTLDAGRECVGPE
jgi:hypothetical protein